MKKGGFETFSTGERKELGFEGLIWAKAEELGDLRKEIEAHIEDLEREFGERPLEKLNLAEREERAGEEKLYWQLQEELRNLRKDEDRLQGYLEDLEEGRVDEELVRNFLVQVQESQDETRISKRKKHIQEEKARTGFDVREMAGFDIEFGANPYRPTTGRRRTSVKNPGSDPEGAFYYYTADTHGGKSRHGNGDNSYVSKSGRRVRKK